MKLLIIRHGESQADLLDVHEGRADYPLTETGLDQAKKMANYISAHFNVELIIASPLQRAQKTAEILQDKCNCVLIVEPDLMEYNNGVLAGMSRKEAAIKYPYPKEGRAMHVAIEGGESEIDFRYRVERILSKIQSEYKEVECIAIVAHGGTIMNLLNCAMNIPLANSIKTFTDDTGIHLIEFKEQDVFIHFLNSTKYLD
ncbi:histidine phosphatase family protein [Rummeliibacillus sp. NPDC094406]|uniref:histidine phosphatase family protein n=1 Tax=Rummeliibacillus sp. NPDC094406 TaxID=3364511 RepID=UPI0037FE354F